MGKAAAWCVLWAGMLLAWPPAALPQGADEPGRPAVVLYYFWGQGCPVCDDQQPFLEELQARYPGLAVDAREIWRDRQHHSAFLRMAETHGIDARSVPAIFVGGEVFVGDSPVLRRQIVAVIEHCLVDYCPDSMDLTKDYAAEARDDRAVVTLPFVGAVDLGVQPIIVSTVVIGLIDGFNPCSLWVLTVLLALVIRSGSRQRVLIVGVTFLVTTALIYGLFIAGVFSVLAYVIYLGWIQALVGALALLVGAVNVKDYFWFRRGLSFTISDHRKPGIYQRIRGLLKPGHSRTSLVLATVTMATGIALVELPCTAGFPVIWGALVAEQQPTAAVFMALLGLYLLLYLLVELVVFLGALRTLSIARFEERHGRLLKLLGGMIMIALGGVLLLAPGVMTRMDQSLTVFAAAVLAAMLVVLARRVTERFAGRME